MRERPAGPLIPPLLQPLATSAFGRPHPPVRLPHGPVRVPGQFLEVQMNASVPSPSSVGADAEAREGAGSHASRDLDDHASTLGRARRRGERQNPIAGLGAIIATSGLFPGQPRTIDTSTRGTRLFRCMLHPWMRTTLTVD